VTREKDLLVAQYIPEPTENGYRARIRIARLVDVAFRTDRDDSASTSAPVGEFLRAEHDFRLAPCATLAAVGHREAAHPFRVYAGRARKLTRPHARRQRKGGLKPPTLRLILAHPQG